MEIVPMNLSGQPLKIEEINRLVLGNEICKEILSEVLLAVKENNDE